MQKLRQEMRQRFRSNGRQFTATRTAFSFAATLFMTHAVRAGVDTWTGNTTANFNAVDGFNTVPSTNDSLLFGLAGTAGTTLTDNLYTPGAYNVSGITFNSSASAYTINPATPGTNGFTLTGPVTNSSTALQTISDEITLGSAVTFTTSANGGDLAITGAITEGVNGFAKLGAGTLTLSGANTGTGNTSIGTVSSTTSGGTVLLSGLGTLGSGNLNIDGTGSILDLNGTSQSVGFIGGNGPGTAVAGVPTITSSTSGAILTVNVGSTNDTGARDAAFSGGLKIIVSGSTIGPNTRGQGTPFQLENINNNFSGGVTVRGTGSITIASLNATGGVTDTTGQSLRINNGPGALGTGTVTLDNGSLYTPFGGSAIPNNIAVTANGGILDGDPSSVGGNVTTYTGSISNSGGILDITNASRESDFSGSMSGFNGTLAIDTTNTTNIGLSGSALGSSNTSVLFFGTGAFSSTLQWNGAVAATPTTIALAELITGAGSANAKARGAISTAVNTSILYSIGDNTTNTPTFAGVISNGSAAGANTVAINKVGSNNQTLSGVNTYTGGTNVSAGTLTFAAPGALPVFSGLKISATATAAAAFHTGSIKNTLFASSLSIAGVTNNWTGVLDLSNNDLDLQKGSLTDTTNQIAQGYNAAGGGNWQGSGGIVSSAAAADTTHLHALGVILNTANGTSTLYPAFDNATAAAITDVLVKYTYFGDANLDGKVDGSDYSRIDGSYTSEQGVHGVPVTGWYNGDFNYDNVVDGSDYTLIDNAFNTQGSPIASEIGSPLAGIAAEIGTVAVPEPASVGMLTIGAVTLLGRRRRSHPGA